MFLYGGSKRSQNIGSNKSQFTFSCEVLNIRERQILQDKLDVFNILHNLNPFFSRDVDVVNWEGDQNPNLRNDISWSAEHRGRPNTFWNLVRSDLPWQLTEGIRSDLDEPDTFRIPEFEDQMLSQHGVYSRATLVRDSFQCFPRHDGMTLTFLPFTITDAPQGFLLTISPSEGINYLNRDLAFTLGIPPSARIHDSDHDYLEYVRRQWSGDTVKAIGTTAWPTPDVDFLMTYIMTKLQRTPTHSRQGRAVPDIQSAYIPIVSELVRHAPHNSVTYI